MRGSASKRGVWVVIGILTFSELLTRRIPPRLSPGALSSLTKLKRKDNNVYRVTKTRM